MDTFLPFIVVFYSIGLLVLVFILLYKHIFNNSEIDRTGHRSRRLLETYNGRKCQGCGLRVLRKKPYCPYCNRDFSQDSGTQDESQIPIIL